MPRYCDYSIQLSAQLIKKKKKTLPLGDYQSNINLLTTLYLPKAMTRFVSSKQQSSQEYKRELWKTR